MVHRVHDQDVPVQVERHPGRPVELTVQGAFFAPSTEYFTLSIELRDPVQSLVRHKKIFIAVGDKRHRPLELALVGAPAAD